MWCIKKEDDIEVNDCINCISVDTCPHQVGGLDTEKRESSYAHVGTAHLRSEAVLGAQGNN